MTAVPETHPRAGSLLVRERLVSGFDRGLVAREGLLAHGRGEAFDYLVGERTTPAARSAMRAGAACLLLAERPVISVNGNLAALCPGEIAALADATGSRIEVNTFYGGRGRRRRIAEALRGHVAGPVLGGGGGRSVRLSGLDSARRTVDADGIYAADVVVVPLEDGDRTEALVRGGKTVIAFDLNPLSRTASSASITIVDNVTRGVAAMARESEGLSGAGGGRLRRIVDGFDNGENLRASIAEIQRNLAREARVARAAGGTAARGRAAWHAAARGAGVAQDRR